MSAQRRKIKREYVELPPGEKLQLLNDHAQRGSWSSLDDTQWCLHCEKQFTGHSARVYREHGMLLVECGTPGCDGSPLDFASYPWWDENHPDTKTRDAVMDEILKEEKEAKPKRARSKKSG
jgi:hypothetical protein